MANDGLRCANREEARGAGRKLAKFGNYVEVVPNGKDLGEASDNYVRYLVEKYKCE